MNYEGEYNGQSRGSWNSNPSCWVAELEAALTAATNDAETVFSSHIDGLLLAE